LIELGEDLFALLIQRRRVFVQHLGRVLAGLVEDRKLFVCRLFAGLVVELLGLPARLADLLLVLLLHGEAFVFQALQLPVGLLHAALALQDHFQHRRKHHFFQDQQRRHEEDRLKDDRKIGHNAHVGCQKQRRTQPR